MTDRNVLKLGGKAIRFQKFTSWVIAPMMLIATLANLKLQWLFTHEVIAVWLGVALLYIIAEGIRRIVLGALDLPSAG